MRGKANGIAETEELTCPLSPICSYTPDPYHHPTTHSNVITYYNTYSENPPQIDAAAYKTSQIPFFYELFASRWEFSNKLACNTYSENSPQIDAAAYRTSQIPFLCELFASRWEFSNKLACNTYSENSPQTHAATYLTDSISLWVVC